MPGIHRSRRIADGSCACAVDDLRQLQLGRLCGSCLALVFRQEYIPVKGSFPPGSSHNRKEDL